MTTMTDRMKKAEQYFAGNFNCSQSVLATFAPELGLDEEMALKIGTQFGGGSRKGEVCGAVSGALMVLGLKYGHYHADNMEEKRTAYRIAEDFMNRVIAEKGTTVCRELLGYNVSKPEEEEKIRELGLFQTVCPEMVRCVTGIVEKMLEE